MLPVGMPPVTQEAKCTIAPDRERVVKEFIFEDNARPRIASHCLWRRDSSSQGLRIEPKVVRDV